MAVPQVKLNYTGDDNSTNNSTNEDSDTTYLSLEEMRRQGLLKDGLSKRERLLEPANIDSVGRNGEIFIKFRDTIIVPSSPLPQLKQTFAIHYFPGNDN